MTNGDEQHPPFITVHSEQITVNQTLEEISIPRGDANETMEVPVKGSGDDEGKGKVKGTVFFSGFLIDLLNEIKAEFKKTLKKDFPKHRIIVSRAFAHPPEDSKQEGESRKGGGFGTKELPKAAGKDSGSDESGGSGSEDKTIFKGLVAEVRCSKKTVALMPMTPTPERKTVVRFTEPFFDVVSLSILMKKPILQSVSMIVVSDVMRSLTRLLRVTVTGTTTGSS